MSPPIKPYTISPHQAGITLGADGRFIWPPDKPRRTKVAIHGGPGWRSMRRDGIFDSDEWVIFSINNFYNTSRDSENRLRADIWWEFHNIFPDLGGPEKDKEIQDEYDMQWIRECPVPMYTVESFSENPNAHTWPFNYYFSKYRQYIACTFAPELMTALEEGFEEVALYGLALLSGTKRETTVESSCVNYWAGFLEGRGVKVTIPDGVDDDGLDYPQLTLRHPYVYGADYWLERRWVEGYIATFDERAVAI